MTALRGTDASSNEQKAAKRHDELACPVLGAGEAGYGRGSKLSSVPRYLDGG